MSASVKSIGAPRLDRCVGKLLSALGYGGGTTASKAMRWVFKDSPGYIIPLDREQFLDGFTLSMNLCQIALSKEAWKTRERRIRQAIEEVKPSERTAPSAVLDPVAAAASIVKSVSRHGVDWSREPQSDRERRIREIMIEKALNHIFPKIAVGCIANDAGIGRKNPSEWPADLREAYDEADRIQGEADQQRRLQEYEAAAREVDGLPPLDDDEDDEE